MLKVNFYFNIKFLKKNKNLISKFLLINKIKMIFINIYK